MYYVVNEVTDFTLLAFFIKFLYGSSIVVSWWCKLVHWYLVPIVSVPLPFKKQLWTFFFFGEFGFQDIVRRTYSTNKVHDIGQPTPATHPQVLLLNTHLHMRFLCLVHALRMSRYKLAIIWLQKMFDVLNDETAYAYTPNKGSYAYLFEF